MNQQSKTKRYDLIIRFNSESYIDLRNIVELKELADWKKYGTVSFRGLCSLDKDDLEKIISEKLSLDSENFQIIKTSGLYVPN